MLRPVRVAATHFLRCCIEGLLCPPFGLWELLLSIPGTAALKACICCLAVLGGLPYLSRVGQDTPLRPTSVGGALLFGFLVLRPVSVAATHFLRCCIEGLLCPSFSFVVLLSGCLGGFLIFLSRVGQTSPLRLSFAGVALLTWCF